MICTAMEFLRVTTGNIKGLETGRLLFVVVLRHGKWTENLRFNLFLQTVLDDKYPGLPAVLEVCLRL